MGEILRYLKQPSKVFRFEKGQFDNLTHEFPRDCKERILMYLGFEIDFLDNSHQP